MKNNNGDNSGFETLRRIEEELFGDKGASRAGAAPAPKAAPAPAPRPAPALDDSWRLSREILEAKREIAALKNDNDSLRLVIMEQNVLSTSSVSALRELRQDYDQMRKEMHELEQRAAAREDEIGRLRAELEAERARSLELAEKAGRQAGHAEIIGGIARSRYEAEAAQPAPAPAPAQPAVPERSPSYSLRKDFVPRLRRRYF